MSEWLAVEAIVRQRDKETQANAIAKLSSESTSGEQVPPQIQRDLSNDVCSLLLFLFTVYCKSLIKNYRFLKI